MSDFDPDSRADSDALDEVIDALARRFDTVQIFVTRHNPETGETLAGDWAAGNYYARRGQVAEWLVTAPPGGVVRLFDDDADDD